MERYWIDRILARRATRELDKRVQEASIDVVVFELTLKLGIEPLWFATFERSDKDLQSDEGLKEFPGATLLCLRRPMFN